MKNLFYISISVFILTAFIGVEDIQAQGQSLSNVEKSLNIGSARELVKNFEEQLELSIEGKQSSCNRSMAEVRLKEFFKKNPVKSFRYIHHGGSGKGGLKYAIGKYSCSTGSYRVLIRFKQTGGNMAVYNLSFTKE